MTSPLIHLILYLYCKQLTYSQRPHSTANAHYLEIRQQLASKHIKQMTINYLN